MAIRNVGLYLPPVNRPPNFVSDGQTNSLGTLRTRRKAANQLEDAHPTSSNSSLKTRPERLKKSGPTQNELEKDLSPNCDLYQTIDDLYLAIPSILGYTKYRVIG